MSKKTFDGLDDNAIATFGKPEGSLVELSTLALPRLQGTYTLFTDVCDTQIGYVLLQKLFDGTHITMSYIFHSLWDTERSRPVHYEPLAVEWAVLLPLISLKGCWFTVLTHHDMEKWIISLVVSTVKLLRWILLLSEIQVDIVHWK